MMIVRTLLCSLAICAATAGCGARDDATKRAEFERLTADRKARILAQPMQTRRLPSAPYGELIELRVSTPEPLTGLREEQTCYVWRDAEFKTASLSCPGKADPTAD